MGGFPLSAIGVLMLVGFGVCYWLGIAPTIRAVLAFVGTILVGTAGFVGAVLGDLATWLSHLVGTSTAWAFGVPVFAVLTLVIGIVFIHDLMPKHTAGKRTGWAGVLLGAILIAGVSGFPALNNLPSTVRTGVNSVQGIIPGG